MGSKLGQRNALKHGESKIRTRLYNIWLNIKGRCLTINRDDFKYYGGRGITICPEWANDYTKFRDWALNNGYADNLEIDRKDNNGNYEPSNCQWITHKENCDNRRNIPPKKLTIELINKIRIKYNSGYYSQQQIANEFNINQVTVSRVINNKHWKNL